MILDLAYNSKSLYISHQVKFRLIYLLLRLGIVGLYARDLCRHSINALTFIDDKANIRTSEKS